MEEITKKLVKSYLNKYNSKSKYEHYRVQEKCLVYLFEDIFKGNENYHHILIKTELLNKYYSTRIIRIDEIAKHIYKLNKRNDIDARLKKGDTGVVNEIATLTFKDKNDKNITRNFYSFATKYCSKCQSELYPIYDKNVATVLKTYDKRDKFANFKNNDLKDYSTFKDIINKFKEVYRLQEYNYRDLDHFLWLYGKEKLNNNG